MKKKVNVSSLLNSALNDDTSPAETVKDLKAQRNKNTVPLSNNEDGQRIQISKEHPKIMALEHLLDQQNFSDRKEQFIFRLSQACFDDYEELTRTVNYKLNKKLSRNDIMRKVLESYHQHELQEVLKILQNV